MKRLRTILAFATLDAVLCCPSVAATEYVIVNNGNHISNSAILYRVNTQTGKLVKTAVLHTGGQGDMYESDLSMVEVAVTRDASCIFAWMTGRAALRLSRRRADISEWASISMPT
jgi:hypothetical protein